jgi:hypothetical protein
MNTGLAGFCRADYRSNGLNQRAWKNSLSGQMFFVHATGGSLPYESGPGGATNYVWLGQTTSRNRTRWEVLC